MTNKKLLIIGYVWPEPNSSAAGTRMMQLISFFQSQDYQITFASPAKLGDHKFDLASLDIEEQQIEVNNSDFDVFLSSKLPGMVIFDRFMMEEQFGWRVEKHCPDAIRILNTEDLHSLREARHQLLKQAPTSLDKHSNSQTTRNIHPENLLDREIIFNEMASSDLAQREIAAIFRSDLTLMISQAETDLLIQKFNLPAANLLTLPFNYEQNTRQTHLSFEDRNHFIHIGNFRHAPNWDAVLTLKSIWPEIRKQLSSQLPDSAPKPELHIYGAYPPKKATNLHNEAQGFLVKGWASDALEVIGNAKVMLAPIRFGAGIKGKLAEAMLCGTPSITTPIGAEAMQNNDAEWNGVITHLTQVFIEKACQLYCDKTLWKTAQCQGSKLFNARYAHSESHHQNLKQTLDILSNNLPTHRLNNFTGTMLRHHQHKSTQYMSQWIEAKNKLIGQ